MKTIIIMALILVSSVYACLVENKVNLGSDSQWENGFCYDQECYCSGCNSSQDCTSACGGKEYTVNTPMMSYHFIDGIDIMACTGKIDAPGRYSLGEYQINNINATVSLLKEGFIIEGYAVVNKSDLIVNLTPAKMIVAKGEIGVYGKGSIRTHNLSCTFNDSLLFENILSYQQGLLECIGIGNITDTAGNRFISLFDKVSTVMDGKEVEIDSPNPGPGKQMVHTTLNGMLEIKINTSKHGKYEFLLNHDVILGKGLYRDVTVSFPFVGLKLLTSKDGVNVSYNGSSYLIRKSLTKEEIALFMPDNPWNETLDVNISENLTIVKYSNNTIKGCDNLSEYWCGNYTEWKMECKGKGEILEDTDCGDGKHWVTCMDLSCEKYGKDFWCGNYSDWYLECDGQGVFLRDTSCDKVKHCVSCFDSGCEKYGKEYQCGTENEWHDECDSRGKILNDTSCGDKRHCFTCQDDGIQMYQLTCNHTIDNKDSRCSCPPGYQIKDCRKKCTFSCDWIATCEKIYNSECLVNPKCEGRIIRNEECGSCTPSEKTCDKKDNDCDDEIDDDDVCCRGLDERNCISKIECTPVYETFWSKDDEYEGCTQCRPEEEVCDGIDNDCNGIADDGICCNDFSRDKCTDLPYCMTGRTWFGRPICKYCLPSYELCDGEDNDCDGQTDMIDGFPLMTEDKICQHGEWQPFDPDAEFTWQNVDGKNWLTPIRNQAGCGSCWAFSAVGSVESNYMINTLKNTHQGVDLSEQEIVSCAPGSCSGGRNTKALNYIKKKGVTHENCFEYEAEDVACKKGCSQRFDIRKYKSLVSFQVKEALKHGPVSFCIDWGGNVGRCDDGILRCSGGCPLIKETKSGHCMVIVGYNDIDGYWIVRNSWGPYWYDGGYGKLAYECSIRNIAIPIMEGQKLQITPYKSIGFVRY